MMAAFREASASARALRMAVVISAMAAAFAAAQDSEAADEALKKGDLAEAKAQLGQAVKRNPADYNAVLSYASTMPPKEALRTADSLSRAQNAPGWAKARGLRFSGDYHFLKEDYKKAADAYLQASKLDDASIYKHLYALSIAMDGQTEAARAIWNGIALDKADELSGEAARHLALLPKQTGVEAAVVNPQTVAPVNQPSNTSGQTAVAPVSSPSNTPVAPVNPPVAPVNQQSKVDDVKTPSTPVAPVNPPVAPVNQQSKVDDVKTPSTSVTPVNPPVAPVNQQSKVDDVKTPSTPAASTNPPVAPVNQQNNASVQTATINLQAAPVNPKPTGPVFTIQVGAFASKENADNLVKRLTGKYDDITVSSTASGDQMLYRVRVGSFQKKEDAVAYADRLIIEAGLSARVTEK